MRGRRLLLRRGAQGRDLVLLARGPAAGAVPQRPRVVCPCERRGRGSAVDRPGAA